MKRKKLDKTHVDAQFLALIIGVIAFLFLGYMAGDIVWIKDFKYLIGLISGMLAVFVGILALLRFYTKKTDINYLFLGTGFLGVGLLEVVQVITGLDGFTNLFVYSPSEVYPLSSVLAKLFFSILFFASWFVSRNNGDKEKKYEKFVMFGVIGFFILFTASMFFVAVNNPMSEYLMAMILGLVSMMFLILTFLGYLFNGEWKYDNFEFWLIFSISFGILSQLFYLPFLNLEYENMINISVWAGLISYLGMLVGFLNSIYEMYEREVEIQKELKKTKAKIEEAYMVLRNEKWSLTKKKGAADKILKDIIKSK